MIDAGFNDGIEAAKIAGQIETLAARATKGDLATSGDVETDGVYQCPLCDGMGDVDGETFTNFDAAAVGVQFFGVGDEFKAHEELWSLMVGNLPLIVAGLRALKRPEPSEADIRKIGMAMREAVWNVCKVPTLPDELTDEQYAALFRAALKAMEGE